MSTRFLLASVSLYVANDIICSKTIEALDHTTRSALYQKIRIGLLARSFVFKLKP